MPSRGMCSCTSYSIVTLETATQCDEQEGSVWECEQERVRVNDPHAFLFMLSGHRLHVRGID